MNSFSATGIILKRSDIGEQDRVVTILTKEYGKLTCIAKGSRKLTSSKLSILEPGNECSVYMVRTHSMPILTQAKLLHDFSGAKQSLVMMRKVFEVLEMLDSLLVDEDDQPQIYDNARSIMYHLHTDQEKATAFVRSRISLIIQLLGFAEESQLDVKLPLKDLIESVTQRKLKAFAYFTTA